MRYGIDDEEDIARVVHEAVRAFQATLGEVQTPPWEQLSTDMRESTAEGVRSALAGSSPEENHLQWMRTRREQGWSYGPVKDFEKKEHPCLVGYSELPPEQQAKDALVIAISQALAPLLGGDDEEG